MAVAVAVVVAIAVEMPVAMAVYVGGMSKRGAVTAAVAVEARAGRRQSKRNG